MPDPAYLTCSVCSKVFKNVDPSKVKNGKLCPMCRSVRARIGNRARAQKCGYGRMSKG